MLFSFALFVSSFGFIGPEKPHWGSGQLRFFFFKIFKSKKFTSCGFPCGKIINCHCAISYLPLTKLHVTGVTYFSPISVYCDQTFTASTGIVSSPSFSTSSFYANNLNCQYDIQVASGYGIKLSWSTFDIKGNMPDCYDDYVEIYIGCGRRSIGKYCAEYRLPDMPFNVYSPDNCLHIKFHSNSSGAGHGFRGSYSRFSLFSGN